MEYHGIMGPYEESVLRLVSRYRARAISIVGFGSHVKGDVSGVSDKDLIIVLEDSTPKGEISRLAEGLSSLELESETTFRPTSIPLKMLFALSRQTGMFVSHFVCTESDFINLRFARIFHTNRMLTKLLSPTSIVMGSMIAHARTLYGSPLKTVRVPDPSLADLMKSLLMNSLLSCGAAAFSIITPQAVIFSLEATKWSLYSTYFLAYHDSPKLTTVVRRFADFGLLPGYLNRFLQLRNDPKRDAKFIWFTPLAILLIHFGVKLVVKGKVAATSGFTETTNSKVFEPKKARGAGPTSQRRYAAC